MKIIFTPRLPTSRRVRVIARMVQAKDLTGGIFHLRPKDWDAIQPAPLDMEEDETPRGCGCLYALRRLFRRKKKSKAGKKHQSNVNVVAKGNKVGAVQDEDEEHTAEVKEKEEEIEADS